MDSTVITDSADGNVCWSYDRSDARSHHHPTTPRYCVANSIRKVHATSGIFDFSRSSDIALWIIIRQQTCLSGFTRLSPHPYRSKLALLTSLPSRFTFSAIYLSDQYQCHQLEEKPKMIYS